MHTLSKQDLIDKCEEYLDKEEMDAQRAVFVEGAKQKGTPERQAADLFDLMEKFASYGFNKSHAAAYALVAYQTAYLKAHYPAAFLAATMPWRMAWSISRSSSLASASVISLAPSQSCSSKPP